MDFNLWLEQIINGLVLGNIYAMLAAGLGLIFGVAHLINFAHGPVCMVGAYTGWYLITQFSCPLSIALIAACVVGALLGLVLHNVAVKPFQKLSRTAPFLTTLGAGMIIERLFELIATADPRSFPELIPPYRFVVGGVSIGLLDLFILFVSVTSAFFLFLFLKFTKGGQAIRAAAQDIEAAQQVGIRVNRVHSWAFALASALGALAGILIGLYYNIISPTMGIQAGLKGFTACVLGSLGNVPAAMAGGLLLGVFESLGVGLFGSSSRTLVAFVLLVVTLFFRPQGFFSFKKEVPKEPMTGTFFQLGKAIVIPRPIKISLIIIALVLPLFVNNPYVLQVLSNSWIFALFAVSLTLVTGTAGLLSLGQSGLMALGAYASALLMLRLNWPFEVAFLSSGVVAAILGTLLSFPAFKLKGHYIAVATLALGEVVNQLILHGDQLTNGPLGISGIPSPTIFGISIQSSSDFYWLNLIVLIAGSLLAAMVMRSPLGRTLRSLREDEIAARSLGIRSQSYWSLIFAFSGFLAGLAGALQAHSYNYINHETFNLDTSILGLTMVLVGGLGNLWGAILGAISMISLPETLRPIHEGRWLIYGLVLILVLRYKPQGILGST